MQVNKKVTNSIMALSGYTLLVLAICSVITLFLLRISIFKPLEKSSGEIKKIAEKDLTGTIEDIGNDEFGRISGDLQNMKDQLRHVVNKISVTADILETKSAEMSESGLSLQRGQWRDEHTFYVCCQSCRRDECEHDFGGRCDRGGLDQYFIGVGCNQGNGGDH